MESMSLSNAVKQREDIIKEYERILETETDPIRIKDINSKIQFCQEEINLLKTNKPLFGKPKPLPQETHIYEPDPEKIGEQKVTVISNKTKEQLPPPKPSSKKIKNPLRETLKAKINNPSETSLRARIMAAKTAAKKQQNT
jgi:hypothetical protein